MASPIASDMLPEAEPARRRRFSLVWLVPIAAILVGGWLVVKTLTEKGPQITVTFKTADGLEAGKTLVKFKSLTIGRVGQIRVSDDRSHVIASVDMDKTAENLLLASTRFWVVKPRLDLSGVSGLGTLVSGAYIEIDPGTGGATAKSYTGLEVPPVIQSDVPGTEFVLLAPGLGSLGVRSPIFYRSVKVGEVLGYEFANDRKTMVFRVFVFAPYDGYIRSATNFWNVSGIDLEVGPQGVKLRMESLEAVLSGGITFETPDEALSTPKSESGTVFNLYESQEAIGRSRITERIPYVAHFEDSVGGLTVGAAVEFRGMRIGTVREIKPEIDFRSLSVRMRVSFDIEPQSFTSRAQITGQQSRPYVLIDAMVRKGLRAQLESKSLLTGAQVVALNFFQDLPEQGLNREGPTPEIPTHRSTISTIADSASAFLTKLNALPLDQLITEMNTATRTLNETLVSTRGLVTDARSETKPLLAALRKTADKAQSAIEKAQAALETVNEAVAPSSNVRQGLNQMLAQLGGAARSLRLLADYLERHPEALVRGKTTAY